jgi:cytochrome c oxidase assembly factor CtaG
MEMHSQGHDGVHSQGHDGAVSSLDLLSFSRWDVLVLALLLATLANYALLGWSRYRVERLDRRAISTWVLGLAVVFAALWSPLVSLVQQGSHLAYMVQLELLMSVAPLLLLLGLVPVLSSVDPPMSSFAYRVSRSMSLPLFTLGVWLLALYLWHLPPLHALVMQSQVIYSIQLLSFVVAGMLFWLPVVGPVHESVEMRPLGKLGYLALAQAGAGLLAAILVWSPEPLYHHQHESVSVLWGLSGLADQRLSGVVMMVVDMLVASTVAGWIVLKALAGTDYRDPYQSSGRSYP